MNNWNFEGYYAELYNKIIQKDNSAENTLSIIYNNLIANYEYLYTFWEYEGLLDKIKAYLLIFVLPSLELCKDEIGDKICEFSILKLQCCIAWRTFDNCIDGHIRNNREHQNLLLTYLYLDRFINNNYLDAKHLIDAHIKIMNQSTIDEKHDPIKLDNIWERCSIYMLPFQIYNINNDSSDLYINYLNYLGLAHDLQDYFNDIKSGTKTLPIYWMQKFFPDEYFDINSVKGVYHNAQIETIFITNLFENKNINSNYPTLSILVEEFRAVYHNTK